ncbi:MAG: TolC family protein [Bacteroidales bacterium]
MIRVLLFYITLLIGALFCKLHAQTWDLDACMRYAVEHNSKITIQQWQNRNRIENKQAARSELLPSLSGGVGASMSFGRTIDPQTNTYSNISNFTNAYELSGSVPLFQGGALINKIRLSQTACRMGLQEEQQITNDVALRTMQTFMDLLYYRACVELAREQVQQSNQLLYQTLLMEELGLKSQAEAAQIRARLAADEFNLIARENQAIQTQLTLKEIMNYPSEEALPIDTVLPLPTLSEAEPNPDHIFNSAKEVLPQIKLAALKLQDNQIRIAIARAGYFPTLSLNGGIDTRFYENLNQAGREKTAFGSQFKNNLGEWVGISLKIPVFRNLSTRTAFRIARNNLQIAKQEQNDVLREWHTEIEKTINDCKGLTREFKQIKLKVAADQLAYEVALKKYEKGMLDIFDLQTAANTLFQAKVTQIQIQLNYLIKQRLLAFYQGIPLIR